jgi:hypothetical protein
LVTASQVSYLPPLSLPDRDNRIAPAISKANV